MADPARALPAAPMTSPSLLLLAELRERTAREHDCETLALLLLGINDLLDTIAAQMEQLAPTRCEDSTN